MPPRLRLKSLQQLIELRLQQNTFICLRCQHMATAAAVTTPTPAPTPSQMSSSPQQMTRYSPTQPPSHRDPKYRKSQLLRSYVSLLQTTPLLILFQHNNLRATEWVGIRRELAVALRKVDEQQALAAAAQAKENETEEGKKIMTTMANTVKLTIVQTNMFAPALRIAEYYRPGSAASMLLPEESDGSSIKDEATDPSLTHVLSSTVYHATRPGKVPAHPLATLLSGPIAVLAFPAVSPAHVKAALGVLSPDKGVFRAPRKAVQPGLYEASVQEGLKKLMLLGARVDAEGRALDLEGVRWMGAIEGGVDGLRGQLVGLLQGVAAGVTGTLEAGARSVWASLEARRMDMEGEKKEE